MSESTVREQVKEMARLTMLSNRLNEIQEKNLKLYPYIFFEGVKNGAIVYDLECRPDASSEDRQMSTYVNYTIEVSPDTVITFLDQRIAALKVAVRTIFWSDLTVNVEVKGGKNE